MTYVKRRIPVEAVQWFPGVSIPNAVAVEYELDRKTHVGTGATLPATVEWFWLKTLENWVYVSPGCWIVGPGADGEYWPVQDDVFKKTYEVLR